jgi:transcriptional regulator with XRE-family HTH domain
MTPKARKTTPNLALKVAIVESRKRQRKIAQLAGIGEVRLSAFVCGRLIPSDEEMEKLAKILRRDKSTLFQIQEAIAS